MPLVVSILAALLAADAGAPDLGDGRTRLHELAERDDDEAIAAVDRLIKQGADVNAVTKHGETALNVATRRRRCAETRRCACMVPYVQPLPPCPIRGNTRMIRALLAHGADPNVADRDGATPLYWVIPDNLLDEVVALLDAGARPAGRDGNQDTIWALMKRPDPRIVRQLLAHGADPNERDGVGMTALNWLASQWDSSSDLPDIQARQRRSLAVARLLLARGADVRAASDRGKTPLHDAASTGFAALARVLIAAGASVNAVDKKGQTPLHHAVEQGHADVVALLLGHGAAATAKDAAGLTPLHALARAPIAAVEADWRRIVRLLVGHGCRFDAQDDAGRTPLFHAAGNPGFAQLLLANGGANATVGPLGASPLHVAVFRDDEPVVRSLIAVGFKVGARDQDGRTPLHWAAFMGRSRALEALAAAPGIDLEAVDKAGHTAFWWAVEACQREAADLLRARGARPPADAARQTAACAGARDPPLHAAARNTNMKEVRDLVTAGVDVNARDEHGRTALHVARPYALGVPFDLYALLVDKGADVGARDAMGRTPLHAAYDRNDGSTPARFPELLVCRGADPNPRDLFGWTPMDVARMRGWRAPAVPTCPSR